MKCTPRHTSQHAGEARRGHCDPPRKRGQLPPAGRGVRDTRSSCWMARDGCPPGTPGHSASRATGPRRSWGSISPVSILRKRWRRAGRRGCSRSPRARAVRKTRAGEFGRRLPLLGQRDHHGHARFGWRGHRVREGDRDPDGAQGSGDALRRSEQTFQLLTESVQDYAIFMLDPEGRVASWNASAERIKRVLRARDPRSAFLHVLPPEDVAQGKPRWELEKSPSARVGTRTKDGVCARTARASGPTP